MQVGCDDQGRNDEIRDTEDERKVRRDTHEVRETKTDRQRDREMQDERLKKAKNQIEDSLWLTGSFMLPVHNRGGLLFSSLYLFSDHISRL